MVTIRFIQPDGKFQDVRGEEGMTLMEAAREASVPGVLAECGGGAICSTCHVHVDPEWINAITAKDATEDALLDLAPGRDEFSRLSCQIKLTASLTGLTVRVPEKQSEY